MALPVRRTPVMRRFEPLDSAREPPARITGRSIVGAYVVIAAALFLLWAVSYPTIAVLLLGGTAAGIFGTLAVLGITMHMNGSRVCLPHVNVCLEKRT